MGKKVKSSKQAKTGDERCVKLSNFYLPGRFLVERNETAIDGPSCVKLSSRRGWGLDNGKKTKEGVKFAQDKKTHTQTDRQGVETASRVNQNENFGSPNYPFASFLSSIVSPMQFTLPPLRYSSPFSDDFLLFRRYTSSFIRDDIPGNDLARASSA